MSSGTFSSTFGVENGDSAVEVNVQTWRLAREYSDTGSAKILMIEPNRRRF